MTAKRLDPLSVAGLELRPSSDGESYLVGVLVDDVFLPITDLKAGRVDLLLDEALQQRQEEAASRQAEIAPEPGTLAANDPGAAPPGEPGDEPPPAQ